MRLGLASERPGLASDRLGPTSERLGPAYEEPQRGEWTDGWTDRFPLYSTGL